MKTTDNGVKSFPYDFHEQSTFIYGEKDTRLSVATTHLQNLNSEHQTVLITDRYLFHKSDDDNYKSDLVTVLCCLKAKKIIYCAPNIKDKNLFRHVLVRLQAVGTVLEFNNQLDGCHDRFWYCLEKETCIHFGTSLNGIGKKICRVDMLTDEEIKELKKFFIDAGIITNGDSSGA